jgi:S1-C subfamily serine protease
MPARGWSQAAVLAVVVIVSMVVGGVITAQVTDSGVAAPPAATATPDAAPQPVVATPEPADGRVGSLNGAIENLADLVAQVEHSVVHIASIPAGSRTPNIGTGTIIDRDGHILTNYHVIEGGSEIEVTLHDNTRATAVIVGTDPGSDLAIIRAAVQPQRLQPATFGDSDTIRVGDSIFAIGNPFSQWFSVTSGIISGINRSSQSSFTARPIRGMIQVDAALNPGNSGGPLFNSRGEVIGVNTSIENPSGRFFVGIGFAVPSNTALRFMPAMLEGETVRHPQLGISGEAVDSVLSQRLNLSVDRGVHVTTVNAGSAASRAGLRGANAGTGDVIIAVDGRDVASFDDLAGIIDGQQVGDQITLTVVRGQQRLELTATLQEWGGG